MAVPLRGGGGLLKSLLFKKKICFGGSFSFSTAISPKKAGPFAKRKKLGGGGAFRTRMGVLD